MRRKDRETDQATALKILSGAEYGNMAAIGLDGKPYIIPLSFVLKEDNSAIYFHCATIGEKLDCIKENSSVAFSAIQRAKVLPWEFSMAYESAIAKGHARIVNDDKEKTDALMLLVLKYAAGNRAEAPAYIDGHFDHTCIVRIDIDSITGKISHLEEL